MSSMTQQSIVTTERSVAQPGSASGLGPEGRGFKSLHSDTNFNGEKMKSNYEIGQEFIALYESLAVFSEQNGLGDAFSYARGKEIVAAFSLGHTVADKFAGADAINERGEGVEYKSTTGKKLKGSYTGISVQPSWDEQVKYLKEEKILKYPEHYFNRFEGGRLVESWRLTGQQVYDILLPKLKKKFATVLEKKDPRLSADVSNTEILANGERII